MDDDRWEPGMPVLDRQPVRAPVGSALGSPGGPSVGLPVGGSGGGGLPASLQGLPQRSVPETRPTPLQRQYINLSVIALVFGVVAITALELGAGVGSPLVKLCVLVGAPILFVTTVDAGLRIWRSAWAWMPVDRVKGLFRLCWLAVVAVGLVAIVAAVVVALRA